MSAAPTKPRIGAQLYTVREFCKTPDGIADTMKKIAAIGYQFVQVSGIAPAFLAQAGKLAADAGLTVAATHIGWDRFQTGLDQAIAEHRAMGCRHLAVGGMPKEYGTPEGIQRLAAELGPVAQALAAAGMDFSYHNHDHEFIKFDGKSWLARLYDAIPPALLKAEVDTFWVQSGGGDPAQWVRRLGPRQPLLHLKDMVWARTEKGYERRFAEVGEGNLNWQAIFAAAEQSGVEFMLVEQDQCYGRGPFESLAISYRNLRAFGYG